MSKALSPRRPTQYSKAVADRPCAAFGTTTVTLTKMIDADPGLPSNLTIHMWCKENADFRRAWKISHMMRAGLLRQECAEITEAARLKALDLQGRKNGKVAAKALRMAAKLVTDTKMMLADYLASKEFPAGAPTAGQAKTGGTAAGKPGQTVH